MYIVIELQTNFNGVVGNSVWSYENRSNAEEKYHLVLAAAAKSGLPCHAAVMLQNDGLQLAAQAYKVEEEPSPEPSPEMGTE